MRYHDGEKVLVLPINWWRPVTDRDWEEALEREFRPRGYRPSAMELAVTNAQLKWARY